MTKLLLAAFLFLAGCQIDHTRLDRDPKQNDQLRSGSGSIPFSATLVPGGSAFPIVNDTDQYGGFAVVANEAAIGAINPGLLKVGEIRQAQGDGITYQLTSLDAGGGSFANGSWVIVPQLPACDAGLTFVSDGGSQVYCGLAPSSSGGASGANGRDIFGSFDGGTIVAQITGDGGLNVFGGTGNLAVIPPNVTTASGQTYQVQNDVSPVTITDAGAWANVSAFVPPALSYVTLENEIFLGDVTIRTNYIDCNTKFVVTSNDAGVLVSALSMAGTPTAWSVSASLIPVACASVTGCTNFLGDAGCVIGSTPGSAIYQVLVVDGGITEQVQMSAGVDTWHGSVPTQKINVQ